MGVGGLRYVPVYQETPAANHPIFVCDDFVTIERHRGDSHAVGSTEEKTYRGIGA